MSRVGAGGEPIFFRRFNIFTSNYNKLSRIFWIHSEPESQMADAISRIKIRSLALRPSSPASYRISPVKIGWGDNKGPPPGCSFFPTKIPHFGKLTWQGLVRKLLCFRRMRGKDGSLPEGYQKRREGREREATKREEGACAVRVPLFFRKVIGL